MSFLKNIFGKKRRPKDLLKLAAGIAEHTRIERIKCFDSCTALVRKNKIGEDQIKNLSLTGERGFIIKSFQLVHILSFIQIHKYLESEIRDFSGLLRQRLCSKDSDSCQPHIERYAHLREEKIGRQFHQQFRAFADDLAVSFALPSAAATLALAIDAIVSEFYIKNLRLAAIAFNDKRTANDLLRRMQKKRRTP